MRADRLATWVWFIVAATYALRVFAAICAWKDPTGDLTGMIAALTLARLYEMSGGHDE